MCMSTVAKDYRNVKKRDFGIGYKMMTGGKGLYHSYLTDLRLKKWYKANINSKIGAYDGKDYRSGFHIFLSEKDARDYSNGTLIRVRYRGVSSIGTNITGRSTDRREAACVIADEMFLEEVIK